MYKIGANGQQLPNNCKDDLDAKLLAILDGSSDQTKSLSTVLELCFYIVEHEIAEEINILLFLFLILDLSRLFCYYLRWHYKDVFHGYSRTGCFIRALCMMEFHPGSDGEHRVHIIIIIIFV